MTTRNLGVEILNRGSPRSIVLGLHLLLLDCCCMHSALSLLLCLLLASQTVLPHAPAYDGLQAYIRKNLKGLRMSATITGASPGGSPELWP